MSIQSRLLLLPLVLIFLVACGRQRQQQRNVLNDLLLMQRASVTHQVIPSPSEDPDRYGKGDPLVRVMHERFVRASALDMELVPLLQETKAWISPRGWKDPEKVKGLRKKAERMVAIVDEYTQLLDETTGPKAMEEIEFFRLGSRFNEGYSRALRKRTDLLEEQSKLLETTRKWGDRMVDLLTLVDEKLVKMDGKIPKFGSIEDAERYRSLNNRILEEKALLGELAMRYITSYLECQKNREDSVKPFIQG